MPKHQCCNYNHYDRTFIVLNDEVSLKQLQVGIILTDNSVSFG